MSIRPAAPFARVNPAPRAGRQTPAPSLRFGDIDASDPADDLFTLANREDVQQRDLMVTILRLVGPEQDAWDREYANEVEQYGKDKPEYDRKKTDRQNSRFRKYITLPPQAPWEPKKHSRIYTTLYQLINVHSTGGDMADILLSLYDRGLIEVSIPSRDGATEQFFNPHELDDHPLSADAEEAFKYGDVRVYPTQKAWDRRNDIMGW